MPFVFEYDEPTAPRCYLLFVSAFVLNHKLEANLITDYLGKVSKTVLEHCICGTHST